MAWYDSTEKHNIKYITPIHLSVHLKQTTIFYMLLDTVLPKFFMGLSTIITSMLLINIYLQYKRKFKNKPLFSIDNKTTNEAN